MVDVYKTDEEQIEAIKKWWKKDGLSTVAAVLIAAGGYVGWQLFDASQLAKMEARSERYQALVELDQKMAADDSEALKSEAQALIAELREKSDGYGVYAAMIEAKYAVEASDLDKAAAALSWAQSQKTDASVNDLIKLRLARVYYAQEKYDDALALLSFEDTAAWDVDAYELEGDIHMAMNQSAKAVVAYEKASTVSANTYRQRYVEMKLNQAKAAEAVVASNE